MLKKASALREPPSGVTKAVSTRIRPHSIWKGSPGSSGFGFGRARGPAVAAPAALARTD
jgi:hypothetical protein